MKQTLLIITALMLVVGCGSDSIKLDINNHIDRGGLKYAPNDDEPYTGSGYWYPVSMVSRNASSR